MSAARRHRRDDAGQATLELVAMLPVVLVLVGILLQLGAVVWAITDTTEAARQGARASSMGEVDGCAAARAALSNPDSFVSCSPSGQGELTLRTETPSLISQLPTWTVTRTAVLPDLSSR